jgi:hypothetical protein
MEECMMKRFMQLTLAVVVAMSLLIGLQGPASAGVLFQDNFNTENGGSGVTNFYSFSKWNVTDGSVDLIGNGYYDFYPGNGLYVDLDGSTGHAGTMATTQTFAAGTYTLTFNLAGNARGYSNDTVVVTLGNWTKTYDVPAAQGFSPFMTENVITSTAGSLVFHNSGGDNVGAILDNVAVSSVPLPTAALLLGPGLAGLAIFRKKAVRSL